MNIEEEPIAQPVRHNVRTSNRNSLPSASQVVYLVILEMKSNRGSKCSTAIKGTYASLKDANNKVLGLLVANYQQFLDFVDREINQDGCLRWTIERIGNAPGDRLRAYSEKLEVMEETNDVARRWKE